MKLGDQVQFKKYLAKAEGQGVYFEQLTKAQEEMLEDDCFITVKKLIEKEFSEFKTGIIVGKRLVGIESYLVEAQDWNGEYLDRFVCQDTIYENIYLVACDLRGFYRVREADLNCVKF